MHRLFNIWKKSALKHDRELRQKNFLKDCVYFKTIPKFLRIKNNFITSFYRRELFNFELYILKKYIRYKYANVAKLNKQMQHNRNLFRKQYKTDFIHYNSHLNKIRAFERDKHINSLNKKLQFWLKNTNKNIKDTFSSQTIPYINLSNYTPDIHTDNLLKKGPKFILNDRIDLKDTIPKYENAIDYLPNHIKPGIRNKLINKLKSHIHNNNDDIEDRKALQKLKKNRDLTIIKSDKTNKIVIMNTSQYIKEMENAINKLQTIPVLKDPCKKLFDKTKKIIKENIWPNNTKPYINNYAPNTPRLFGNYKDHKNPPTMRPIVSRCEGPTYSLEKYMVTIYNSILPVSDVALNSSTDFIYKLQSFKYLNTYTLVSFDVVDLYPSINTDNLIPDINNAIKTNFITPISDTLISTNNLILNNSYFRFNNQIYKQNKGLPMGSPVSGVLAEFKLRNLENNFIKNNTHIIKFWTRYVDDVFAIINGDPQYILHQLNKIDPDLKFTVETEDSGTINYLDVKIIINNKENRLDTTVYRKPTASNEIIHIKSKTPNSYKEAALISYINRAILFCSNKTLFNEEIYCIKTIARNAGFSENIVNKLIKTRKKKINNIPSAQKTKPIFTPSVPFNKGISMILKREAAKHNIIIPIQPNKNIFQRVRGGKDNLEILNTAGIYKIPININNNKQANYIGMTKRTIKDRINEHKNDIKTGKLSTALSQLYITDNITIDFEKTTKIANYNSLKYALKREAIEIVTQPNTINQTEHAKFGDDWHIIIRKSGAPSGEDTSRGEDRERRSVSN